MQSIRVTISVAILAAMTILGCKYSDTHTAVKLDGTPC